MVAQRCEYIKCHRIVHFNKVNFMLHEFYLNEKNMPTAYDLEVRQKYLHKG